MKIKDVMHKGVSAFTSDAPLAAVAKAMKDNDVGAIPITQGDNVVGMVTDRDLAIRAIADGRDLSKLTAKDVMSKNVACCQEDETIQQGAQMMESRKVRRLPVLDQSKKLVGMLSLGDISKKAPKTLTVDLMQAVAAHHA